MIFKPELAAKVLSGEKTETRRPTSENPRSPWYAGGCLYRVGHEYAVQPGRGKRRVAQVKILSVDKAIVGEITERGARDEGFRSRHEFIAYWKQLHGDFDPNVWVWVLSFRITSIERAA